MLPTFSMDAPIFDALTKDIKAASSTLGLLEVKYLVQNFYAVQEARIQATLRLKQMMKYDDQPPHKTLQYFMDQQQNLEDKIKSALDVYSNSTPLGQWARSQKGIGPILSSGLLSTIDITRAPSAGHLWSYAGLNPDMKWEKGELRPFNALLKTLCWKIGESFVKVSGGENPGYYGTVYAERKLLEIANNEAGQLAEQAAKMLLKVPNHAQAATYKLGRLPDSHIHSRAKRYAVKLFLAHYFEVAYEMHYHTKPPAPYPIAYLGHVDYIAPPH